MAQSLPPHLKKYVVEQDYDQYTPVDHACWRYILRQLRQFLKINAHECYLEGLEKTGIEVERIPRISEISEKIEKFGWRAIPVSGFIPPAAFMELQSLGFLPIASAMRSIDHLLYTPAPDIVHEAAGHAPILIHPDFANYLREYSQVAKKAIISSEDLAIYEAIRALSDIKENPDSTIEEINSAQKNLESVSQKVSHISEAAELGRMNWWTAEYGLIGDLQNPKIFGAGLLSSVGESKECLKSKVKKIPLSLECIRQNYDITEPQPQLFVARDFKQLSSVLEDMAQQMAFRVGGISSIEKAIKAKSVNTIEFENGLQISGICDRILIHNPSRAPLSNEVIEQDQKRNDSSQINKPTLSFLHFSGPTQISYKNKEIEGHSKSYHTHGFSSPFGKLKNTNWQILLEDYQNQKITNPINLEFESGIRVHGNLKSFLVKESQILIASFENCRVTFEQETLFDPSWGIFDLAIGNQVTSVFGGPADRLAFGETSDFAAIKVPTRQYSDSEKRLFSNYQDLRSLRESSISGPELDSKISHILDRHSEFSNDWLLYLECYEVLLNRSQNEKLKKNCLEILSNLQKNYPDKASVIQDGLLLAQNL